MTQGDAMAEEERYVDEVSVIFILMSIICLLRYLDNHLINMSRPLVFCIQTYPVILINILYFKTFKT